MLYRGFAGLESVGDLFEKLKRDYSRLIQNGNDPDFAFNFIVTALHLIDWLYPNSKKDCDALEASEPLLKICFHIANGAKHFEATAKKHDSVSGVEPGALRLGSPNHSDGGLRFGSQYTGLIVKLSGEAEERFGSHMPINRLATHLLKFWESKLSNEAEL